MSGFKGWLSSVPVVFAIWLSFTAGLVIEINRFFPDSLVFYLDL
ncbi:photosystem I protein J (plastid) [Lotharella oceanica]|uniref:Photosystem I reaction center subunit IX n=1 Tax=Lotharella oceanica TaxID=641309 RepID=A0A059SNV4_9EUKA|nr:photosystem I protein J [Lotharella oceanica]